MRLLSIIRNIFILIKSDTKNIEIYTAFEFSVNSIIDLSYIVFDLNFVQQMLLLNNQRKGHYFLMTIPAIAYII
ncbi:MAG: hypothetical protein BGO34_12000 [Bacteroidia bacterium 44-10]|nr:MAG: hypothetical protein BGO34_12000 [Bacteroidia bacterium 44-10]